MEQINYTIINHTARLKLGLTISEYCVADLIYHLANNPQNAFPGWCYASKEKMGEQLGMTKRGVNKVVARLIEQKIVERHPERETFLRTTINWYQETLIKKWEQSSQVGTEFPVSGNKVPEGGNKVHTTIDNTIDKDKELHDSPSCPPEKTSLKGNGHLTREVQSQLIAHLGEVVGLGKDWKPVNYVKQITAISKMTKAGYTPMQIAGAINYMAKKDTFFRDKPFDMMTVANNIDKIKAKVLRQGGIT